MLAELIRKTIKLEAIFDVLIRSLADPFSHPNSPEPIPARSKDILIKNVVLILAMNVLSADKGQGLVVEFKYCS